MVGDPSIDLGTQTSKVCGSAICLLSPVELELPVGFKPTMEDLPSTDYKSDLVDHLSMAANSVELLPTRRLRFSQGSPALVKFSYLL